MDGQMLLHLGEVLDFLRALWALDHALQRASKRMETMLGVTGPQRLALRIVGRFPGIAAGQLAEILHVHPSTLTGVLKRLERQDLMVRRADPRDRRRARLGLTAKGRKLAKNTEGTIEAAARAVLSELPRSKPRITMEVLGRLAETLARDRLRPRPSRRRSPRRAARAR